MNLWFTAATVLLFALVPCGILVFRFGLVDRLVGLEVAGVVETLVLLLLAEGSGNSIYFDLALALALLMFGGSLVFVRFLERWL